MRGVFQRFIGLLWAAFAAVLIAVAALVTIVRLLLPEIGTQRAAIEVWIAETVGRPALVGDIKASWSGWSPRISVDKIAFYDPSASSELVSFERAVINIAPLGSIIERTLKPKSLILSGVELTLIRHEDGHISVAGMPPPKSPIIVWLIEQNNFAVTEADLTIIDVRSDSSFVLSDVTLTVRNQNGRRLLSGYVDLPASWGRHLSFELSAKGDLLGSDWDGMINFRLDDIRTEVLSEHLAWQGEPPPDARATLVAWTEWSRAKLQTASFDLRVDTPVDLAITSEDDHFLHARGRVFRRLGGWRVDVEEIDMPSVVTGGTAGASFSTAWETRQGILNSAVISGQHLPLEPVAALAVRLLPLDASIRDHVLQSNPSGTMRRLDAAFNRDEEGHVSYLVTTDLEHLSFNSNENFPGVTGLDASLGWGTEGGWLALTQSDFKIDYDARLPQALDVADLSGSLSWRQTGDETHEVRARTLKGVIGGVELILNGTLQLRAGTAHVIDVTADIVGANAVRLHHLLPSGIIPKRGEDWSRELFVEGRVTDGRVVVRGPLDRFPFDKAEGVIQVDFDVNNAIVKYSRRWPFATALDGRLKLRGRQVEFKIDRGFVSGANIAGAEVTVPDLFTRKRFVRISGTAHGPASSASDIIMASPLKLTKAARIQNVDISGDIEVALDMNLALYRGGPREVLGQALFRGNRIAARQHNIVLENVFGNVSFTRGDWYGEGLTAEFDGSAVGLVVNGGLDDPNYDSEFRMTGTSDAAELIKYLKRYASPLYAWLESKGRIGSLNGALPWKAVLTIPTPSDEGSTLPRRLTLESSLLGLDVDLPWPFGKHSAESKPLRIETVLKDRIALATRIDFGDTMDVEIISRPGENGKGVVERIEVLFGSIPFEFKHAPGITMRGYIPQLSLTEWADYLHGDQNARAGEFASMPANFDIQVKQLHMFGRKIEDVRLLGSKEPEYWNVQVSGVDASGRIAIPRDITKGSLNLDLERLHLVKIETQDEDFAFDLDPRRIPTLEFACESLQFEAVEFGRAEIRTTRLDKGLKLDRLAFSNADFSVEAVGDWIIDERIHSSRLIIDVESGALAPLLNRFDYTVANIEGGATNIHIDASWQGTLADFTLDRMTGTFELHVVDGRFLDIDPGSGRLFGLLSLQTLPRRLSFDFTDLFKKGFTFDSIDGVFELELGNAYTNSLLMDGPAARIDISGRTGLAEKDYDQHVVVTPALSSSIPLAAALFGPIGAGAGAVYFIGEKMFKSIPDQVNKFLTRKYTIKGSWEDPVVERI